jgi:hypothetical protein
VQEAAFHFSALYERKSAAICGKPKSSSGSGFQRRNRGSDDRLS